MTGLGVWSCQWRELRPINFGGNSSSGNTTGTAAGVNTGMEGGESSVADGGAGEQGDEELGYGRGRKKSRFGRDGAGDYELVAMKEGGNG